MNIDNYLDIIFNKHINKVNANIDDLLNPLIYNKMLDSVSYIKKEIIITNTKNLYILNTYCFDIITDITSDSDISIVVDNREINNFENLTLPITSLKEKIYIKLNNKTTETFNVSYKGYILNGIPLLEFSSYYNKYKIYNNYGLEFLKGNLNKNNI
jgi:hypothetical protein